MQKIIPVAVFVGAAGGLNLRKLLPARYDRLRDGRTWHDLTA